MLSRDAVAFRRMLNAIHIALFCPAGAIDPAVAFAQFVNVIASAISVDQAERRALADDSLQPVSLPVDPKFVSPDSVKQDASFAGFLSAELAQEDAGVNGEVSEANSFPNFTVDAAPMITVRDEQPTKFDTVRAKMFLASLPWMGAIPAASAKAPSQSTVAWEASSFDVSEFLADAYFSAMPWDTAHPQRIQVGSLSGQSHSRLSAGRDTSIGQTATLQAIRDSRGTLTHSAEFFSAVPWMKSPSPQIGATA